MKKRKLGGFATFQEFADAIGWHRNSLRERLRIADCPVRGKPPWKADDAIRLASWFARWKAVNAEPAKTVNTKSLALDDYRGERTALARLERMEREGLLVRVESVGRVMRRIAERFRTVSASLLRQFGNDAYTLMEEAIDDLEREFGLPSSRTARPTPHPGG